MIRVHAIVGPPAIVLQSPAPTRLRARRHSGYDPGMSDDRKKPGWAIWMIVAVALTALYVLSSGPARSLLMHRGVITLVNSYTARRVPVVHTAKWDAIYAPLNWVSREKFGAPLRGYWRLFPIRGER